MKSLSLLLGVHVYICVFMCMFRCFHHLIVLIFISVIFIIIISNIIILKFCCRCSKVNFIKIYTLLSFFFLRLASNLTATTVKIDNLQKTRKCILSVFLILVYIPMIFIQLLKDIKRIKQYHK